MRAAGHLLGIKVWIGDEVNGHHAETMFSRLHMGWAGQWLVDWCCGSTRSVLPVQKD